MQRAADVDAVRAFEDVVRLTRRLASAGDLSLPAAAVLARLVREGPQRLTDLAGGERLSQPGMTQLVSRLEREGLVRRTSSPADGRVVLVEVSAAGRDLADRRRAERAEALHRLLGLLDPEDRDAVHRAVPALTRLAELALPAPGGTA